MKRSLTICTSLIFALLVYASVVKAQHIEILQQGKPTSIRGLSVVDDNVAWVSGSKGTVAITTDGGKTWDWKQVKGFEKSDFRDVEAFSEKEAVIMSSGTPALILKTIDGGASWQVKYKNIDTAYFLDAMAFADKQRGYILGDPIKNKFVLLETKDNGETWDMFKNRPGAMTGEAAFAASGTCIIAADSSLNIVTGGTNARLLTYDSPSENSWDDQTIPLLQGKASQGIFSVATGDNEIVMVGGDYANDKRADSTAVSCTIKGDFNTTFPARAANGFQSCVVHLSSDSFLSTGTPGSNFTADGGKNWQKIDGTSYNVCKKAKKGKLVLLAGDGGKIGIFNP